MFIPEEYVIIGAAIEPTNGGVRLKDKVHVDDVGKFKKKLKFPIEYYEDEYKFCKLEGDYWKIEGQPPITPQLVQALLS